MVLSRVAVNVARAAPHVGRRSMSSNPIKALEDVKLKDLPGETMRVAGAPETKTWWEGAKFEYYKTYVKTGSAAPIFHVIGIMMAAGYSVDYFAHLRHEANYKYH